MGGGRKLLPVTTFTVAKRKPEKNSGFYGIRTLDLSNFFQALFSQLQKLRL